MEHFNQLYRISSCPQQAAMCTLQNGQIDEDRTDDKKGQRSKVDERALLLYSSP